MATRTVQFIGLAHSPTGSLNATLHVNNVEVFNGTITASATVRPSKASPRDASVLFEFELDRELHGTTPLVLAVSGDPDGQLAFFNLQGNYTEFVGLPESYSVGDKLPFMPDYWNDLCEHTVNDDGRVNVKIDDIPKTRWDEDFDPDGTTILGNFCWWVATESVLSCDLNLIEFVEQVRDSIGNRPDMMSVPVSPPRV